jgi:hypothetical protein
VVVVETAAAAEAEAEAAAAAVAAAVALTAQKTPKAFEIAPPIAPLLPPSFAASWILYERFFRLKERLSQVHWCWSPTVP